MSIDEIDFQISELETRIDRLRALYEQYFMGFERTEPQVPKKDVERRIHELRKIRFNNTARRFKFQTLIQRYNTMQQYWSRICREIELGTYKRHKLKAERTIGAMDPALFGAKSAEAAARKDGGTEADPTAALDRLAADATEILDAGADLDAELNRALVAAAAQSKPAAKPAVPLAGAPEPAPAAAKPAGGLLRKLGRRPDAPDGGGAALGPLASPGEANQPAAPKTAAASARDSERPNKPITIRPTVPLTRDSSRPPPPSRSTPDPLPPALAETVVKQSPNLGPPRPASIPAPRPPTAPKRSGVPAAAPTPPPAPAPKARGTTVQTAAGASLSEAQLRALHESYQKARASTNAAPVSFEKLERSLRETERQLREKTKGRAVEFEVTVEAGRAVIKPKLA